MIQEQPSRTEGAHQARDLLDNCLRHGALSVAEHTEATRLNQSGSGYARGQVMNAGLHGRKCPGRRVRPASRSPPGASPREPLAAPLGVHYAGIELDVPDGDFGIGVIEGDMRDDVAAHAAVQNGRVPLERREWEFQQVGEDHYATRSAAWPDSAQNCRARCLNWYGRLIIPSASVSRASQSQEAGFVPAVGCVAVVADGTGVPNEVAAHIGCRAPRADPLPERLRCRDVRSGCRSRECSQQFLPDGYRVGQSAARAVGVQLMVPS